MPARVDLVIPGLFDLPPGELDSDFLRRELPYLNRFLGLAGAQPNQAFSVDSILLEALAHNTPGDMEEVRKQSFGLPLAQAFAATQAQDLSRYLVFQAIHLKPDLHSALIMPLQNSQTDLNEIDTIINDLSDVFKVDCDIHAIASGVYLMRLHGFDAPRHYPHILSVLGKSANPYIEQSRAILPWYKLLNEMQMFLHQHEINQNRILNGLLPANSLWFWGGGVPTTVKQTLLWYCDDPLLNRFAQSLGMAPESVSALNNSKITSDALIVDLRLLSALKSGQGEPLTDLLLDIDQRLFKPVLESVEAWNCRLGLRAGFQHDFEMHPYSKFKFWKSHKSLLDWQMHSDGL